MTEIAESAVSRRLRAIWATPAGIAGSLATVDHKTIGIRYVVTAMIFLILGGVEALVMRVQLARPDAGFVSPQLYNELFTMHGVTMLFLFALPVLSGFSNYLWPLMIGARDMAFPRINAVGYWLFVAAGVFIYTSMATGTMPNAGWFNYVPLSSARYIPRSNIDYFALGMIFLGLSTTAGAINFVVTFFKMRAPGMSIDRVPILLWGTVTVSVSILFALPALTASCLLLYLDRHFGMHFFDPDHGGQPLLWQHLFWMFGHPWVYIVVLPAMSMASDMLPTTCRRPLIGYTYVALATVSVGILGFGVWVHHMFAVGLSPISLSFFSGASMAIAIPSAVSVFAWIATMWYGRPVRNTVLLFIAGFIVLFVIGGVDGVVTASAPFDWQVTDSYYIVAHLHYVLIGINVFPVIAGVHYWFPKATGRLMSERLGRLSFWLMFLGFNIAFFPMHFLGLLGMPRRIYTYAPWQGWAMWNLVATIGSFTFALGFLVFVINVWRSYRKGDRASANPWGAGTLEWSVSSPPPPYNFVQIPRVASRHPLWEGEDDDRRSVLDQGPALDDGHQAVSTTALEARPTAILPMPGDSLWPFYLSVATLFLFYGLVYDSFVVAGISAFAVAACMVGWLWPGASIAQFDEPEEPREAGDPPATTSSMPMSDLSLTPVGIAVEPHPPGQWAMALLIVTEASLFAYLLFSYFYLDVLSPTAWLPGGAPALRIAIPNTAILLSSSVVLYWAERRLAAKDVTRAKWGLMFTMLLGALFLCLQGVEYAHEPFRPQSNAYGSAFFTITGLHGAHVFVGLLLLGVVLTMLWRGKLSSERRHFLSNAALYWHFVDAVWIAVFASLYLAPRLGL